MLLPVICKRSRKCWDQTLANCHRCTLQVIKNHRHIFIIFIFSVFPECFGCPVVGLSGADVLLVRQEKQGRPVVLLQPWATRVWSHEYYPWNKWGDSCGNLAATNINIWEGITPFKMKRLKDVCCLFSFHSKALLTFEQKITLRFLLSFCSQFLSQVGEVST